LVFLCLINVFFSTLTVLHWCFPLIDIKENTIFFKIITLCCLSWSEISRNKSLSVHSSSATISFVISMPWRRTVDIPCSDMAFSNNLRNVELLIIVTLWMKWNNNKKCCLLFCFPFKNYQVLKYQELLVILQINTKKKFEFQFHIPVSDFDYRNNIK